MEFGQNVDVRVDITADFSVVDKQFAGERFDTIFCLSVLEHIPDVFAAAQNITGLIVPGGTLFLSVPFAFRFHGYPGDYWRFTPEGLIFLFKNLEMSVDDPSSTISTLEPGDIKALSSEFDRRNRFIYRPKGRKEILRRKKQKQNLLDGSEETTVDPYFIAPTMINMVGVKGPLDAEELG